MLKKKLLFLTNDFPPEEGGMEICAFEISEGLKEFFDVRIIIGGKKKRKESFSLKRIFLPKFYPFKFLSVSIALFYDFIISGYDLIYINTWSPFGLPVMFLSKIFRIKYFITCHGLDIAEPVKSRFHYNSMKLVLKNASKLFCVSSYTQNLVKNYCGDSCLEKSKVINNGINFKKFYRVDSVEAKRKTGLEFNAGFIILTVSRLTPRKGHKTVISALSKIINLYPDILYVICGRGETEFELKSLVEKLNMSKNVCFTGFVQNEDLIYYYNSCDLFVMLSDEILESGDVEGFGVSYLEANACGKPVIALNKSGAIDAVKHNVSGFLLNPDSDVESEFNGIIQKLYAKPELIKKLGVSAEEYVRKNFSWDNQIQKYFSEMTYCLS
ncbi:MAG TPA: glycosyltransferase family 4 protein [bacterium]|nr:glycosyltransferase family 4 protein [bacterium]